MLLLAQHPGVVALQQADFFRRLAHFGRWFETEDRFGSCVLARGLRGDLPAESTRDGLARLSIKDALPGGLWKDHSRELARGVYDAVLACAPGAEVVVEQTPEYVQVWERILEVFPDAWFVHVVRDPRSVFCSHKSAAKSWADPTRFSHDPFSVGREWVDDVTRGRAIGGATRRYVELRYEELKADGPGHLRRLFETLELPADDELCRRAVEACSLQSLRGSKHAPSGFFRAGQTDGWRSEMSGGELRALEHAAGETMRELGYETVNGLPVSPPLGLRVRRTAAGARNRVARWAWSSDGVVRRGTSRVLKAFPSLRRSLLKGIKRPV